MEFAAADDANANLVLNLELDAAANADGDAPPPPALQCLECTRIFRNFRSIDIHYQRAHKGHIHLCGTCHNRFRQVTERDVHVTEAH